MTFCSRPRVRLVVLDDGGRFDHQTHAYAEYRVFSTLAGDALCSAADVTVTLTRLQANGAGEGPVLCSIALASGSGRETHVHVLEPHAYEAIDRAAELVVRASRRTDEEQPRAAAGARRSPAAGSRGVR